MADFTIALDITLKYEGLSETSTGYVNHPNDRGGETNFGITKQSAINNGFTREMKDMTLDDAKVIYKKSYWDVNKLSDINDQNIANKLFDIGVNMGVRTAGKMIQKALNLMGTQSNSQKRWDNLIEDGIVGSKTIETINKATIKYNQILLNTLQTLQRKRYIEICEKDESQKVFFYGWMKRSEL